MNAVITHHRDPETGAFYFNLQLAGVTFRSEYFTTPKTVGEAAIRVRDVIENYVAPR